MVLDRGMAANIAIGCQNIQIAFAADKGTDNQHARHTSDVRHDMMQLQVHLHQRFLHVLYVGCCVFHQAFRAGVGMPSASQFGPLA